MHGYVMRLWNVLFLSGKEPAGFGTFFSEAAILLLPGKRTLKHFVDPSEKMFRRLRQGFTPAPDIAEGHSVGAFDGDSSHGAGMGLGQSRHQWYGQVGADMADFCFTHQLHGQMVAVCDQRVFLVLPEGGVGQKVLNAVIRGIYGFVGFHEMKPGQHFQSDFFFMEKRGTAACK